MSISDFISTERDKLLPAQNNLFAITFRSIESYQKMLNMIIERFNFTSIEYIRLNKIFADTLKDHKQPQGELTIGEIELISKIDELAIKLRLDIESYYVFAKILLDHTARGIEFYFGESRSNSLDSHHKLVKNITLYSSDKSLKVDQEFIDSINLLKKDISDFRDQNIAHQKERRRLRYYIPYTTGLRMVLNNIYPKDTDQVKESENLYDLNEEIHKYIRLTIEMIIFNSDRCCLALKTQESPTKSRPNPV